MLRKFLILMCACGLSACGSTPQEPVGEITSNGRINGREAYVDFCAGCHETGMLGAPIAGDAAYWKGRSTLWQAVLMEHAKQGYYDMPPKGGRPDVSDARIDAATEYMLSVTFPDLPADQ